MLTKSKKKVAKTEMFDKFIYNNNESILNSKKVRV